MRARATSYSAARRGLAASLDLSSLATGDGSTGFVINGIDQDDRSGRSVSSAGDVNGDGVDDILIGAGRATPNGNSAVGESYVVFGRNVSPCGLADVNLDGMLDASDFSAWITAFNTQGPGCDQNGDGMCLGDDFSAWLSNTVGSFSCL